MSLEIEAKLKIDRHDEVRQHLRATGAQSLGQVLEVNQIFDDADHRLLSSNRGLRVRTCYGPDRRIVSAAITYKGPQQPGTLKTREEIELRLEEPRAMADILIALGFTEVVRFEKRRESWRLVECTVELDEVPHLGCYVEIEGPDETRVRRVQENLGLGQIAHQPQSYIALLAAHRRQHDLPLVPICFP